MVRLPDHFHNTRHYKYNSLMIRVGEGKQELIKGNDMTSLLIKSKVLQEIDLIPDDKLTDVYNFIHYFRLGLEKAQLTQAKPGLAFAGCWQDMPDEMFNDFTTEITQRRHQAFIRRRGDEGIAG